MVIITLQRHSVRTPRRFRMWLKFDSNSIYLWTGSVLRYVCAFYLLVLNTSTVVYRQHRCDFDRTKWIFNIIYLDSFFVPVHVHSTPYHDAHQITRHQHNATEMSCCDASGISHVGRRNNVDIHIFYEKIFTKHQRVFRLQYLNRVTTVCTVRQPAAPPVPPRVPNSQPEKTSIVSSYAVEYLMYSQ